MAVKELKTRLRARTGTTSEWNASTTPLLQGELGIEVIDANQVKMKIGTDNIKKWSELPYFTQNSTELASSLSDTAIMSKIVTGYPAGFTPEQSFGSNWSQNVSLIQALTFLKDNKIELSDARSHFVSLSVVSTTATSGALLRLDSNGKLPASITGDSSTVGGKSASDFLWNTGGTMTGDIILKGDPSNNLHPATKQYVDTFVPKSGATMTGYLTLNADPTNAMHAVTKQYADQLRQGIDAKQSCKVATTTNISLTGTQTIDGIALSVGDRVLVKNQATSSQNGIYVVASGAWTRADDADTSAKLTAGAFVFIEQGTVNEDTGWVLATNGVITIGTTNQIWTQFSSAGIILADETTITKNINTLSLKTGVMSSPGTYRSVTVDTYGRITAGSNPTTLSGYGISDAIPAASASTTATANRLLYLNANSKLPASIEGEAASASKWTTSRTLTLGGDLAGNVSFDGSANVTLTSTLGSSGVVAGTYNNSTSSITPFTVDSKGRITGTSAAVLIQPQWSSIQSKPDFAATYEPKITKPGTVNSASLFWNGDKQFNAIDPQVRGTTLTGYSEFSTASGYHTILPTDTVLEAFGKLAANDDISGTSIANKVNKTVTINGKQLNSSSINLSLYDLVDVSAGDTIILWGGGANG